MRVSLSESDLEGRASAAQRKIRVSAGPPVKPLLVEDRGGGLRERLDFGYARWVANECLASQIKWTRLVRFCATPFCTAARPHSQPDEPVALQVW